MKRLVIPVVVSVVILTACAIYHLEQSLPKDIREFYELHRNVMLYPVPEYVSPKKMIEAHYFLRLPTAQQRAYMKIFWDIRFLDAKANFALRVKLAKSAFRGEGRDGWRTDRGILMLQCGQPDYIDFEDSTGQLCLDDTHEWSTEQIRQTWSYWAGSGLTHMIKFTFVWVYRDRTWRFEGVHGLDQIDFIQYQQNLMAPTDDGWASWLGEIR
jgi:GWxTD domain-containing protein